MDISRLQAEYNQDRYHERTITARQPCTLLLANSHVGVAVRAGSSPVHNGSGPHARVCAGRWAAGPGLAIYGEVLA